MIEPRLLARLERKKAQLDALRPLPAAVHLDDAARNGQSQPCPTSRPATRLFTSEEALEDVRQVIGTDTLTRITDGHFHA